MKFDCITSWEVFEHIPENLIPIMLDNICRHLNKNGIFVGSIDTSRDENPLTGAVYHVTLREKKWWMDLLRKHGLEEVTEHPFKTTDYIRGHGMGLKDWDPKDGEGFHVVLRLSK